jgi:hypothetical protein
MSGVDMGQIANTQYVCNAINAKWGTSFTPVSGTATQAANCEYLLKMIDKANNGSTSYGTGSYATKQVVDKIAVDNAINLISVFTDTGLLYYSSSYNKGTDVGYLLLRDSNSLPYNLYSMDSSGSIKKIANFTFTPSSIVKVGSYWYFREQYLPSGSSYYLYNIYYVHENSTTIQILRGGVNSEIIPLKTYVVLYERTAASGGDTRVVLVEGTTLTTVGTWSNNNSTPYWFNGIGSIPTLDQWYRNMYSPTGSGGTRGLFIYNKSAQVYSSEALWNVSGSGGLSDGHIFSDNDGGYTIWNGSSATNYSEQYSFAKQNGPFVQVDLSSLRPVFLTTTSKILDVPPFNTLNFSRKGNLFLFTGGIILNADSLNFTQATLVNGSAIVLNQIDNKPGPYFYCVYNNILYYSSDGTNWTSMSHPGLIPILRLGNKIIFRDSNNMVSFYQD